MRLAPGKRQAKPRNRKLVRILFAWATPRLGCCPARGRQFKAAGGGKARNVPRGTLIALGGHRTQSLPLNSFMIDFLPFEAL